MKQDKPLWQWSACDLAAAIKKGEISCREAVTSVIERMHETAADRGLLKRLMSWIRSSNHLLNVF